jgi:hypothetical protein
MLLRQYKEMRDQLHALRMEEIIPRPRRQYGHFCEEKYFLPCRETSSDFHVVQPVAESLYQLSYLGSPCMRLLPQMVQFVS